MCGNGQDWQLKAHAISLIRGLIWTIWWTYTILFVLADHVGRSMLTGIL